MFEVILYQADISGRGLEVWRRKTFNTFSAAQMWADSFAAIELDEFENGEEFEDIGEYNFVDLYYEIIAR
jgi:hypothetical protein